MIWSSLTLINKAPSYFILASFIIHRSLEIFIGLHVCFGEGVKQIPNCLYKDYPAVIFQLMMNSSSTFEMLRRSFQWILKFSYNY